MNIIVIVKANSKKDEVESIDGGYKIHTKSPSRDGKANISVIYLLAQHLNIPQGNIKIKMGFKSKKKIVEITE